ncbi:MAG TPA: DUF3226 domain-containing protein [Longimicrobium sp.]|nr:DUF3226 domain-containing protein [Longimicrobium sp.]
MVEGTSDHGVITKLWARQHQADQPFEIDVRFGLENLREAFAGALLGSEIERLAVVVDADESVERRWPGFYQILKERGYRPDKALPASGLMLHRAERNVPVVGVWLMPDNHTAGRLENFVSYMVPAGDQLWEHAGEVVDAIPGELRKFKDQHKQKAHVHTWLAWQKEPGLRLGPAVERRLLDAGVPEAVAFVSWLERVFVSALESL